jgi:hypothetical protein
LFAAKKGTPGAVRGKPVRNALEGGIYFADFKLAKGPIWVKR